MKRERAMEAGRAPHAVRTVWHELHGLPAAVDGWLSICMPNLKRVVIFIGKSLGESQKFEFLSSDPGHVHLGVNLWYVRGKGPSCMCAKFETNSFIRSKVIRGSQKFGFGQFLDFGGEIWKRAPLQSSGSPVDYCKFGRDRYRNGGEISQNAKHRSM